MSILQIEKRVYRPGRPNIFLNSFGSGSWSGIKGDLLAKAELRGPVTFQSTSKKLSFRERAVAIFKGPADMEIFEAAQKEALRQVGTDKYSFYRLIPDTRGDIILRYKDYSLFSVISPGMVGILIGEIVEMKVEI